MSIGDSILPGRYIKHSAFRRVANYTGETGLVSLVDESVGAGPYNIVIGGGDCAGPTEWPGIVDIDTDVIRFDDESIKIQGIEVFDSTVQSLMVQPSDLSYKSNKSYLSYKGNRTDKSNRTYRSNRTDRTNRSRSDGQSKKIFLINLSSLIHHLSLTAPTKSLVFLLDNTRKKQFHTAFEKAYYDRMTRAMELIVSGSFLDAVSLMKGCGFGLTPSGDDCITGMMTGLYMMRISDTQATCDVPIDCILDAALGENLLSNAFLKAAATGRADEKQKRLLASLYQNRDDMVLSHTARIMATGETSGADWLTGLVIGIEKELNNGSYR